MRALLLCVAALAAVGCKKSPAGGAGLDQVNESFNSAGLKVEPFVPTDAARYNASRCLSGRIEGVEALLCEYGSPETAKLGHPAGEEWIATANTGVAVESGRVMLVLADRARVDPNGRAITRITRAFQGKK
jgi:hypothetical protein